MREINPLQTGDFGNWMNERCGKLTGSRMSAAMAYLGKKKSNESKDDKDSEPKQSKVTKKGSENKEDKDSEPKEAKARWNLKVEILSERITQNMVNKFVSKEMLWGIEQEPFAKSAFENKTGLLISDLPFVPHPRIENCGASPDGMVSDGCLFESKCPSSTTHLEWILAGEVPEEHKPQMILQSACFNGIPVYFCSYDPRMKDGLKLFIRKFEPTKEEIEKVEKEAVKFLNEIEQMFEILIKEQP